MARDHDTAHGGEPPVLYEVAGRVARITLNRPAQRNALSAQVTAGLLSAFARARSDDTARVVVLTGAGEKSFCAGGDLSDLARLGADGAAGNPAGDVDGASSAAEADGAGARSDAVRLFSAFRDLGKPVIARIAGHALGGGLGLAVSCDVAIAAGDVKLGTPEIKVGLWPMMIMAVLNRNIAPKQALKLYYTGELISAAEAARIGLISEAVARDDLDGRVDELATSIAAKSPAALRLGRAAFFDIEGRPLPDQLAYLHGQLAALAATDDAREGIAAFLEKRAPRFTGN
ncbi:MAG: enoyl-CoA hydratase-related protein [Micromonosporaceae bacterium]